MGLSTRQGPGSYTQRRSSPSASDRLACDRNVAELFQPQRKWLRAVERDVSFVLGRASDDPDVRDTVQDTVLAAMKGLPEYDVTRASFATHTRTIARRIAGKRLRKLRTRRREALSRPAAEPWIVEPLWSDPSEDTGRLAGELEAVLARLSDADRAVVAHRRAGLSDKEIASRSGLSVGAVRVRFHRAVRRVRTVGRQLYDWCVGVS